MNCEVNRDECASRPCLNGGACRDQVDGYSCSCSTGFAGRHCEQDLDECESNPCKHGGECINQPGYYECQCFPGYEGKKMGSYFKGALYWIPPWLHGPSSRHLNTKNRSPHSRYRSAQRSSQGEHAGSNRIHEICVVRTVVYITKGHISQEIYPTPPGFTLVGYHEVGQTDLIQDQRHLASCQCQPANHCDVHSGC